MKYFSNNPRITDTDAKIIGEFIHKRFKGQVTAKALLDVARSPKCPVHKYFEWDDTKAAEQYRLDQARKLIVSIYVEADDKKPIRHFLNVRLDDGQTYMRHESVADSTDLIEQVIESAKDQLLRWKERYGRYCEYFRFELNTKGETYVIENERSK